MTSVNIKITVCLVSFGQRRNGCLASSVHYPFRPVTLIPAWPLLRTGISVVCLMGGDENLYAEKRGGGISNSSHADAREVLELT